MRPKPVLQLEYLGQTNTHNVCIAGASPTRIVGLAKIAKKSRARRRVEDATVSLFPEIRPGSFRTLPRASDMDGHDQIPVMVRHVLEADVTEDAGIVDQDVDAAEVLNGRLNDLVAVDDIVVVSHCPTARRDDLSDDLVGKLRLVEGQ